jgi:hypothetical protein
MATQDTSEDSKLRRLYDAGVNAFEAGRIKAAAKQFRRASKESRGMPLEGFIDVLLADCYYRLGDLVQFERFRGEAGGVLAGLTEQGRDEIAASLRTFIEQLYENCPLPEGDTVRAGDRLVEVGMGLLYEEASWCAGSRRLGIRWEIRRHSPGIPCTRPGCVADGAGGRPGGRRLGRDGHPHPGL